MEIFHRCTVQCACSSHCMMFEPALACFSVSPAQLSTYPLLRTIDKVTSIHPHIWIRFSLVSMVNNRTKGLGWMEAGRAMQEHLCSCTRYLKISSVYVSKICDSCEGPTIPSVQLKDKKPKKSLELYLKQSHPRYFLKAAAGEWI